MNVNDIQDPIVTDHNWKTMFARQQELIDKYKDIEAKVMNIPALYETVDWNSLDNNVTQLKIKEYLWRISEEIGESYECVLNAEDLDSVDVNHQMEELADALHFTLELLIHLGFTYEEIPPIEDYQRIYEDGYSLWDQYDFYLNSFTELAKIGNCLKNKPWKQTQMKTDNVYMFARIEEFLTWMMFIFFHNGFKPNKIYTMYMKKSMVNKFRQDTNY